MEFIDREIILQEKYNSLSEKEKNSFYLQIFDENFQHGGYEDCQIFLDFLKLDKRLIITPRVQYWHEEGATRFSEQEIGTQNIAEKHNLEYFLKKNNFNPHQNILDFLVDERINY